MSDQDSSIITATPGAETNEGPSMELLSAHHTTAEELENSRWAENRTQDIAAHSALKTALGQDYQDYQRQIESLSGDERIMLAEKTPEEIASHLDDLAAADRAQERQQEEYQNLAAEQAEAVFSLSESPEAGETRRAMKAAFEKAQSLDAQIAELQRLNELRDDPGNPEWDKLDGDLWLLAREGKATFDEDILSLIQQRQASLLEVGLHQNAYNAIQSSQAPPPTNQVIGLIPDNSGQPQQLTRADIASIVQLERDEQAHLQRVMEASKRYPDWEEVGKRIVASGVDVGDREAAFIRSLPNSADVVYYLGTHPRETMALARMPSHEASRELINISHNVIRQTPEKRQTQAPKPPTPVGGSSSRAFDVNDESLSEDEWMRKRNAQLGIR